MILGMFAGIRAAKLRRLHRKHIQLDRRMIALGTDVTKKRRRRVIEMHEGDPIGDCLMAWLSARPLPERVFAGNLSTYRRHFRRLLKRLGFGWVKNGLRHTAAKYCYGLTSDIVKTAALLGEHDIRALDMRYRGLALQHDAEAFYALQPAILTAIPRRLEEGDFVSGTPGGI
jgi:integrase